MHGTVFHRNLKTAFELYSEAKNLPVPADRFLGNFFHQNRKRFGSKDRKAVSETLYGLFRHRLFLESWFGENPSNGPAVGAAALVLEGLMDEAAYKEAGSDHVPYRVLIQRELRYPAQGGAETFSLRYSIPLWMTERWLRKFGNDAEKFFAAVNMRPPLTVRANPVKTTRDALIEIFRKKGHDARPTEFSPWGIRIEKRFNIFEMEEFLEGYFEVQDEGSQLVSLRVDPKPGEIVWDVCAGGGGKTLLLGALMENQGRVVATDIRLAKLDDLRKRAKRAGLFNIFPADLRRLNESAVMRRGVDKILVDAPCSGTGTIRRNPDAKWKITESMIENLNREQKDILENSVRYLKPGGSLVYATCSIEPEENEQMVETFLKDHPQFGREGTDLHYYPHLHGTDGFFVSRMVKSF